VLDVAVAGLAGQERLDGRADEPVKRHVEELSGPGVGLHHQPGLVRDDHSARYQLEQVGALDQEFFGNQGVVRLTYGLTSAKASLFAGSISQGVEDRDDHRAGRIGQHKAAFYDLCDGYLVKPIQKAKLLEELSSLNLI
jgi:hypothetical protein